MKYCVYTDNQNNKDKCYGLNSDIPNPRVEALTPRIDGI